MSYQRRSIKSRIIFDQSFAPRSNQWCFEFLALAAFSDFDIDQMNRKTAFLHGLIISALHGGTKMLRSAMEEGSLFATKSFVLPQTISATVL